MAWIIGIDEAGYGPNLGPFVMTAVACQVPDRLDTNLWQVLGPSVRKSGDPADDRLLIDDSKVVYSTVRGLLGLERGVFATLWRDPRTPVLDGFVQWACQAATDLPGEAWYKGTSALPLHVNGLDLPRDAARFDETCAEAGVTSWRLRSVVVCPPRFNALLDAHGSKGAVLAHALAELLRCSPDLAPGDEALSFFIDKHGGRNAYAAQIQHALPGSIVVALEEGVARSSYRIHGLGRKVQVTFQPRADGEHFCVALASMTSKYLREVLMGEFNGFWQDHVPGLKATAGYPGDAARFLEAIRAAAKRLGIAETALWRRK
jgi:ribonuclease HII